MTLCIVGSPLGGQLVGMRRRQFAVLLRSSAKATTMLRLVMCTMSHWFLQPTPVSGLLHFYAFSVRLPENLLEQTLHRRGLPPPSGAGSIKGALQSRYKLLADVSSQPSRNL
jgi:hypothetical protein